MALWTFETVIYLMALFVITMRYVLVHVSDHKHMPTLKYSCFLCHLYWWYNILYVYNFVCIVLKLYLWIKETLYIFVFFRNKLWYIFYLPGLLGCLDSNHFWLNGICKTHLTFKYKVWKYIDKNKPHQNK